MPQVVRMGIIGVGSLALEAILPHLTQEDVQDRLRVTALSDPVPGRAAAAAERFGVLHAFTDLDELLAGDVVDAVTVAAPIGLHHRLGKAALGAGKHVHFNKAMATTVAEATDLIETARARRLKVVASPGQVLHPRIVRIKQLITEGAIGIPCWAICGGGFGTYHEQERARQGDDVLSNVDPSWYFRKPGGGPLYDMTVYSLHELTTVLGPARRVAALSGIRIKERNYRGGKIAVEADDNTVMLLDYGDSLYAMVYGTAAGVVGQYVNHSTASYFGTAGSIGGKLLNGRPFDYPGRPLTDEAIAAGRRHFQVLPHVAGPHLDIVDAHVFEDIMQLVDWISLDRPSPVTAEQARHVIDIFESAYRAAETGQVQELRTTFSNVVPLWTPAGTA
jgi:predicted dehydrogenase